MRDTGLGFRVRVDYAAKKLIFEVYSGAERLATVAASELTAYDMTYTCDRQENVNSGGWYERKMEYKGTWNPKTNTPTLSNKRAANAYTYYRIITATYTQFGIKCTEGSYLYSDTADGAWKVSEEAPKSVWVNIPQGSESGAKKWETVLSGQMTQEEAACTRRTSRRWRRRRCGGLNTARTTPSAIRSECGLSSAAFARPRNAESAA